MRLSLKTKLTLGTSLLVLAVVALVSGLYLGRLMRQTLRQANDNAFFIAQQVYSACGNALKAANERGDAPASLDPADCAITSAAPSTTAAPSIRSSNPTSASRTTIYEITISDQERHRASVERRTRCATRKSLRAPPISSLVRAGFFEQLRELYGPPQIYEFSYPFESRHRSFWRYPHQLFLGLDSRRNLPGAPVGRHLGAGRCPVVHALRIRLQPHRARADRAHLRAIGPHFGGPV